MVISKTWLFSMLLRATEVSDLELYQFYMMFLSSH